jgi:nucleotide-binding universal stress UspA family protein
VLMVPKEVPQTMGETIAVAWNGSTETALTVALGMPFLLQARHVIIIAVGPQHMPEPGPTGEELAQTLERHGLNITMRVAVGRQKPQGESFLKEAVAAGADMMLKGAYTQSRIRQMIFGGATRHLIMESSIPVLMAR